MDTNSGEQGNASSSKLAELKNANDGSANLTSLTSEEIVKKFGRKEKDTGSPEVQVALITKRLQTLAQHFTQNAQDRHSQRGMMSLISARKGLLQYLKDADIVRYRSLIGSLGLRK